MDEMPFIFKVARTLGSKAKYQNIPRRTRSDQKKAKEDQNGPESTKKRSKLNTTRISGEFVHGLSSIFYEKTFKLQ